MLENWNVEYFIWTFPETFFMTQNICTHWVEGTNWRNCPNQKSLCSFLKKQISILFVRRTTKPQMKDGRNSACPKIFNTIIRDEHSTRQTEKSCSCLISKHIFLPLRWQLWHYLHIFNVHMVHYAKKITCACLHNEDDYGAVSHYVKCCGRDK